jgi:hypothetical protein
MSVRFRGSPVHPVLFALALIVASQAVGCGSGKSGIDPNIKVVGPPAGDHAPPTATNASRKGRQRAPTIWERRKEVGKVAKD